VKRRKGGKRGAGGVTPAAAAPSTKTATNMKRMMTIMRRIVEVTMTMQFNWPCCTFTWPFGRQILEGKRATAVLVTLLLQKGS
jgi:hypothetical protein